MGNKREQLKEDIAHDLGRKIETTQQLLGGLMAAQGDVRKDCEMAKFNFQRTIDELTKALAVRKTELTKQIDSLCHTQINSLQESIQATFIALGSLQSTLANLDSFDNGQLLNLAIPDYPWSGDGIQVSFIDLDSECTQLKDEISSWATVKGKELITVQKSPEKPKSAKGGSSFEFGQALRTAASTKNVGTNRWYESDVEDWLCTVESKLVTDFDEDFEIVHVGAERPLISSGTTEANVECDNGSNDENEDCSSSISVVQSEPYQQQQPLVKLPENNLQLDLSKWLRPKRAHIVSSTNTNEVGGNSSDGSCSVVPEELTRKFPSFSPTSSFSQNSSIPSKRQYLDFPCLRLDPKCWLQKKRVKDALCSDVCFNLSQKEIIPPSYALPYPFWLKKC